MRKLGIAVLTLLCVAMLIPFFVTRIQAGVLIELGYDDDSFEDARVLRKDGVTMHLRQKFGLSDFGLSGPIIIDSVRVYWGSRSLIDTVEFDIRLRDNEGTPITVASGLVSPTTIGWQDYDVSAAGFESNNYFYVELIATSGAEYVGMDTAPPRLVVTPPRPPVGPEPSYSENGDTWTVDTETIAYGIRVTYKLPSGIPEFGVSIPIITSIALVAYLAARKRIGKRLE